MRAGKRISIIMPVLNEGGIIDDSLSALQTLRAEQHEVIVVDGGSSDNSVEIARPLSDRVLCCDKGRAVQMNAGAEQADGDVLLFLHSDTLLPDNAEALIIHALQNPHRVWGRFDVRFPDAGITLDDITLAVRSAGRNRLRVEGGLRSGEGRLTVDGALQLDAARGFPLELRARCRLRRAPRRKP